MSMSVSILFGHLTLEDAAIMLFRNFGRQSPRDKVPYFTRTETLTAMLQKPVTLTKTMFYLCRTTQT
jgi:hypothetical protein